MKRLHLLLFLALLIAGAGSAWIVSDILRRPSPPRIAGKTQAQWDIALASDSPDEVAAALETLANEGEAGLEVLLDARKSPNVRVHRRAVQGLIRVGEPAVPALVAALEVAADRAEVALIHIGPPAVPRLTEALRDPKLRKSAARLLGILGPAARPALGDLAGLAADREIDPAVRVEAILALGEIGLADDGPPEGDPGVMALTATLNDGSGRIRRAAALALVQLNTSRPVAVGDLLRATRDGDTGVVTAACLALSQSRSPAAAAALLARLREPHEDRQRPAALALARLGPAAAPAAGGLLDLTRSSGTQGRLAFSTLARLGPAALPALQTGLASDEEAVRRTAADLLGLLGPPARAAASALEKAGPRPQTTASLAGRSLLAGAEPLAPLALTATLLDGMGQSEELALAVAAARVRVDPDNPGPALPALLALLSTRLGDDAALALVEVGELPPNAIEELLRTLRAGNPVLVRRAAHVLPRSSIPPARLVPALRQALKERPSPPLIGALERLGPAAREAIGDLEALLKKPALRAHTVAALARIDPAREAEVALALLPDLDGEAEAPRTRALAALGRLDHPPPDIVPSLRPLLARPDLLPVVLGILRKAGPGAAGATADLVGLLSDRDPGVRRQVARTLAAIGRPVVAPLKAALRRAGPSGRQTVLETIRWMDEGRSNPWDDWPGVAKLLLDRDPAVRLLAAQTIGSHLPADRLSIPLNWLGSANTDQRATAARLLAAQARLPAEARVALIEGLLDPDEAVRAWSARGLGKHGRSDDPLPLLQGALRDRRAVVRLEAAHALLARDPADASAIAALLRLATGENAADRQEAAEILLRQAPAQASKALPGLLGDLHDSSPGVAHGAAVLLIRIQPGRAAVLVPWLIGRLQHPDAEVRFSAAGALRALGPRARAAEAPLARRALRDDDPDVRAAAEEARKAIRPGGKS